MGAATSCAFFVIVLVGEIFLDGTENGLNGAGVNQFQSVSLEDALDLTAGVDGPRA